MSELIIFTQIVGTTDSNGLVWIGDKPLYLPAHAWTISRDNWVNINILGSSQGYCAKITDSTGTPITGNINFGVVWVKFSVFS